jgi:hypothetical protein
MIINLAVTQLVKEVYREHGTSRFTGVISPAIETVEGKYKP